MKVLANAPKYVIMDGILYHLLDLKPKECIGDSRVTQLVVPDCLKLELLHSYHDSLAGSHNGPDRTFRAIRQKYYWDGMYLEIYNYVKSCNACQLSKKTSKPNKPPLVPLPIEEPFSRVHMDILTGFAETKEGYKHVLLLVDSFTKWPEAFPMVTMEATEVADILFSQIFTRYGACVSLLTDRGANFLSRIVQALCDKFGVKRLFTPSFHPATNGQSERMNRYLAAGIRAYCAESPTTWHRVLPGLLMVYRNTPCTNSTGLSPYMTLFGREMRTPIDNLLLKTKELPATVTQYLSDLSRSLDEASRVAADNLKDAQQEYKKYYDRAQLPEGRFQLGDYILMRQRGMKGKGRKADRPYIGPLYVTLAGPNYTYRLRHVGTNKLVPVMVHATRLIKYTDPDACRPFPRLNEAIDVATPVAEKGGEAQQKEAVSNQDRDWYAAKKLVGVKLQGGHRLYRVVWEEETASPTWEKAEDISPKLIEEYHIKRTLTGKVRKRKTTRD